MNLTKKVLLVLIGGGLLLWGSEEFLRRKIGGFAGSYPFVESWVLDVSETELIQIITEMKEKHPNLQPPFDTTLIGERHSYWCFIKFYYPDSKEIVHTWVRPNYDTTKTTLAFYSLTGSESPNKHRLINRDFWYLANKNEIRKFEKTIVDPLKTEIIKKKQRKAAHKSTDAPYLASPRS